MTGGGPPEETERSMNIGFIGCGKMGEAILKGLPRNGDRIVVSRRNREELERIRDRYHVETGGNREAAACDIVFLAVKPQQYGAVIPEIRDFINPSALLVYLAPGIAPGELAERLGAPEMKIIHMMPNTPCEVCAGVIAYSCGKTANENDEKRFASLVASLGIAFRVEESQMNAVVGMSGSSPAYFYMMLDAMAKAGVRAGLKRRDAYLMAAQAMLGSAKLALESEKHPSELRDDVCSPGGTTIEAVHALDKAGFEGIVMDAVAECIARASGMGK